MVLGSDSLQLSSPYSDFNCTILVTSNCSPCLNYTCESTLPGMAEYPPPPYSAGLTAFLGLIAAITSLFTTTGNILVVLAFILERHLWQPSNYLIASLAVTDILIGMFSMPFYTLYLLRAYWPLGRIVCNLWLSLDYTVCLVSQYTVFLITLDRFCSVKAPAKYRNWRTTQKIKFMIVCIWIAPAAIFFTTIMGWDAFRGEKPDKHDLTCEAEFQQQPLFTAILVISYYWVTLVVMVILYMGIYRVALSLHQKARTKRNRLKKMGHLTANNNDLQPLNGSNMSRRETSSIKNEMSKNDFQSNRSRENRGSINELESDISNENSSDSVLSNKKRPDALNTAQTPSIIVDHTPGSNDQDSESPLWKPRPSLPITRINWDAFSQDTSSSLQVTETTECNDSSSNVYGNEQKTDEAEGYPSEKASTDKTTTSIGKIFSHLGKLRFKHHDKGSPRTKSKSENRARKALRTISFILGAFVVCWTPYHVTVLVAAFCKSDNCVNTRFYEFTYWLCYLNSPLNPFCYALSNNQFKKAFLRIIKGEYFKKSCCHKKFRR